MPTYQWYGKKEKKNVYHTTPEQGSFPSCLAGLSRDLRYMRLLTAIQLHAPAALPRVPRAASSLSRVPYCMDLIETPFLSCFLFYFYISAPKTVPLTILLVSNCCGSQFNKEKKEKIITATGYYLQLITYTQVVDSVFAMIWSDHR